MAIDLQGLNFSDPQQLATQLRDICHHIGFFVVVNHGITHELIDRTFTISKQLFALPMEQKMLIDKRKSRHFRGWEAVGVELTNNQPDFREQVDIWSEHPVKDAKVLPKYLRLLGPNQSLPDSILPNYEKTVNEWFAAVGNLADALMGLLALGLELPQNYFDQRFGEERMSFAKLIHYPKTPAGQFGVNAHSDSGFMTVLAAGETPGLEVRNSADEWIPVPIIPNSFVINIGEMLQSMTGNYYVATPHRVFTNEERYSIAYFHGPSLDTIVAPANLAPKFTTAVEKSPYHAAAKFMSDSAGKKVPLANKTYGDFLWEYFSRSYPKNMEQHYPN